MKNNKISTPIADFAKKYALDGGVRMHMPGHKGKTFVGCEKLDITEIKNADSLYEADGIIAESENNAAMLFGTGRTVYSTEGSSQSIRAMMYLIMLNGKKGRRPVVAAARNAHKSFIYAAALLDFEIVWLWPDEDNLTVCSCQIDAEKVERVLKSEEVDAVYITSPDYLGKTADIGSISKACKKYGAVLAVDNAHGAYLSFLEENKHPIFLGADICCDSAHKTLPVLTGGGYLHISRNAPEVFREQAKYAMELFGSTSPSYLIMESLDVCNGYIADGYKERLKKTIEMVHKTKNELGENGWVAEESDPLKITVRMPYSLSGDEMAERLRERGIECEYADPDYIVLMATPENDGLDFEKVVLSFGRNDFPYSGKRGLPVLPAKRVMSVRNAVFSMSETVSADKALGRICRVPTVSCPPAIPIAVPGEEIDESIIRLFKYYGIEKIDVVKE